MLLPRLQPQLRASLASIGRAAAAGSSQGCLNEAFGQLSIRASSPVLTFVRHASHAQQGAVNKAKDGPGKRLGAKKSGGTFHSFHLSNWAREADCQNNRTICDSRQHYIPPTRHPLVPGRKLRNGTRSYDICDGQRIRQILQGSREASKETIHWSCLRAEPSPPSPPK